VVAAEAELPAAALNAEEAEAAVALRHHSSVVVRHHEELRREPEALEPVVLEEGIAGNVADLLKNFGRTEDSLRLTSLS